MDKKRYLTKKEVLSILDVARKGKNGVRNYCLILMAFRHGYRISELLRLKLTDIDLISGQVFINRSKNGLSTIHPIDTHEIRTIQEWIGIRESYPTASKSNFLFISEYGYSLSRKQAWYIVKKCGQLSDTRIHAHPHMLRHACGYTLANEGADTRLIQDYLGHRNIRHTVHYTTGNPERFVNILPMMSLITP